MSNLKSTVVFMFMVLFVEVLGDPVPSIETNNKGSSDLSKGNPSKEKVKETPLAAPDEASESPGIADENWEQLEKHFELSVTQGSFEEGQKYCKKNGMTYAEIWSKDDQDALEKLIVAEGKQQSAFWIGGQITKDTKTWVDSSKEMMFEYWAPEYPERQFWLWLYGRRCIMINEGKSHFHWTTSKCRKQAKFACQYFTD